MFALDLFNTKYEKELKEGAVDSLEARRIDDLNMKMQDLLGRAKGANPKMKAALKREFQRVKAERDSYFKINSAAGMNENGNAQRQPKFDPRSGMPVGAQLSEFGGDATQFGTPTQSTPTTEQPPRRGYSIILTGKPGKDWMAEYAWQALETVFPREYPGNSSVSNYSGDKTVTPAMAKVLQAHNGPVVVKSGINSEDIAETLVSKLAANRVPAQYWRISSQDLEEGQSPGPARGVDANGRTQAQWLALVKAKFPPGGPVTVVKLLQAKMPDGPMTAHLSNGKQIRWSKVEQAVAEGKDNPYGYHKGQTVKLNNGQQGRVIDIFDDSIEVLLVSGRTVTVDFRDAQVISEQGMAEERRPYGDYPQSPRAFGTGNFQRIVRANMGNLPTVTLEFPEPKDNINLDKKGLALISDYYDGLENDSIKNHFIYRVLPSADEVLTVLKRLGWNQAVQPELPGIPTQGELPLQEKKKFDSNSEVAAGDVKVARELQKLRAQYPAAKSDLEAVAKAEIDSSDRSQQQLAAIKGANTEQDRLLQQLIALDKKQGTEIGSLDNENSRLEQQLAYVEQTNAKLAQAIDQINKQSQSSGDVEPQSRTRRVIDLLPAAPADAQDQPQPEVANEPPEAQMINLPPTAPADDAPTAEPENPTQKSNAIGRMAQSLSSQPRRVQGINQGPAPSIRGDNITDINQYRNDAVRRAQAAIADRNFKPLANQLVNKGVVTRTGTDESLNEFAPAAGGGSGNYFQALASAWYNGTFDTGSLQKGIKSKEDVERLLNRGIVCPDGVTRKYAIDYNSDFDGVVISSDDYYEHSDYNDQGQEVDSRNGQPWGPNDYMEFSDDDLSESVAEGGSRYDDNRTGFGRDNTFRNQERNAGLENEQNNIQISINGKPWKVVPGKGYADSAEERAYLNGMRRWAEKKSTSSGKKWTVSLTGANPTVNELSNKKLGQYKQAAALDAGAADKRGDFERGNKRFSGIVKATKKQFANDVKKHKPIQPTVKDSLEEIDRRGFLRGLGAAAIGAVGVGAAGSAQARSSDASRKEDDEALALLAKGMTPEQVAKKLGVTGPNHGQTHQMGGQWASINRAAAQLRRQQQGTQGLNEFAPGAGGDDEAGDDPYKYPKPKRYNRSADFFGQFEADHFDREDFDDATGVFKGYWGNTQIAYFKFDNPAQTGGNNPGMGWYYEPESNGNSDTTSTKPAVDNSEQRKQQELGMIRAFLKSGNRPNPDSQIGRLMKKHGIAEGSSTASDAVERAILNRIMIAHTDLLMKFGPDKVMQAAEEVAYNVGDVDEIGTSDVSAYVNQVRQILGA